MSFSGQTFKANGFQWKDKTGAIFRQLDEGGLRQYWRKWLVLEEYFKQLPQLNAILDGNISTAGGNTYSDAVVNAAFLATNKTNSDFEVLGTNMTSALVTFAGKFDAGAGIKLATAGADADSAILLPHLNSGQTSWAAAGNFMTQKQARHETVLSSCPNALITTAALTSNVVTITTDVAHGIPTGAVCTVVLDKADSDYDVNMALLEGTFTMTAASATTLTYSLTHANISSASIAGSVTPAIHYKQIIYSGLKLTNTHTIATDNDSAYFRFDTASTLGPLFWHFITTRANVDTDDILPVACVPGGQYHLVIEIDDQRRPHVFINGYDYTATLSAAGQSALTTDIRLIPYTGTVANGTTPTAKAITVMFKAAGQIATGA